MLGCCGTDRGRGKGRLRNRLPGTGAGDARVGSAEGSRPGGSRRDQSAGQYSTGQPVCGADGRRAGEECPLPRAADRGRRSPGSLRAGPANPRCAR